MKILGSQVYGTHAVKEYGYPIPPEMRARVAGALESMSRAAHVGVEVARSVPMGMPILVMAAVGGIFGATVWGLKGAVLGLGLGGLAGYGATQMPDISASK